ncbi:MAG: UDP-N-acetylmuramoyl-tripeptide--D-alanyl-D-alanine ligase [Deltaproteobacteria bacterium]|nr:UDP-N-acetylmuramoyl-tripeptide--D-alanyl-D-alanine ligase [Deltaproteobacteria bacterium]
MKKTIGEDIPIPFGTPLGRMQVMLDLFRECWPILSWAAQNYRRRLAKKCRVVAVVGTFGKSTASRCIATALGRNPDRVSQRNTKSFLARGILQIRPNDRHAVIEVAIGGPGEMAPYAKMIRPDITVVTSIGSEHHDRLGSLERTRAEKCEMVRILPETGVAVLNGDDPNVRWMKEKTKARAVHFGLGKNNVVRASNILLDWPQGTRFTLHVADKEYDMNVRLIGRPMVYSILAGVAVAYAEGLSLSEVLPALESLSPTPGRLQPVELPNGAWIIRDDCKSTVETVDAALDVFSEINARSKIAVFGEIYDPPGSPDAIYERVGERLAKVSSRIILIGDEDARQYYEVGIRRMGFPDESLVYVNGNVAEAIEILRKWLGPGDVALIKGSHRQRLERIALSISGRVVKCLLPYCNVKTSRCEYCSLLGQRWTISKAQKDLS